MRRTLLLTALAALIVSPAAASAAAARWCHRIGPGERLAVVAARYGTTVDALRRLNGLRSASLLRPGRRLALPSLARVRRGGVAIGPLTARRGHLGRENALADREDLSRIRDRRMLRRFVRSGLLITLPRESKSYWVSGVPSWLRVTRPWTKRFIEQLAAGLHGLFGTRLKVTSLTRTVGVQRALATRNGNAAPARGRRQSVHLTGAAVDLSKRGLERREIRWLRHVLRRLTRQGLVSAIEERFQPHFHVLVSRRYARYARTLDSPRLIGGC